MRTSFLIAAAVLTCFACSAETSTPSRSQPVDTPAPSPPAPSPPGPSIDNPDNPDPAPTADAGAVDPPTPASDCSPGLYLGTYDCELAFAGVPFGPLQGDVSFNLSINEMTIDVECESGEEFCPDLVISENGGTLYGIAAGIGVWGFETMLDGALDCTTGEFRATGFDGRWGEAVSTDPNDPDALWTVADPPSGTFEGELNGTHASSPAETISGQWLLQEGGFDITCAGPFSVTLQP